MWLESSSGSARWWDHASDAMRSQARSGDGRCADCGFHPWWCGKRLEMIRREVMWSDLRGQIFLGSSDGGDRWITPNLPESCHSEWKHLQWTEKAVAFVEIMCVANRCWNKPIRKNKYWGSHQRPVPGLRIITAEVELVVVVLEAALAWDPQNGMSQLLLINLFINTSLSIHRWALNNVGGSWHKCFDTVSTTFLG